MARQYHTTSTTDPDLRDALVKAGWEVYQTVLGEDPEWRLRAWPRDYTDPETVRERLEAQSGAEEAEGYDPMEGVEFASDAAMGLAIEKELDVTAGDFEGVEPSGETGYTKADIAAIE